MSDHLPIILIIRLKLLKAKRPNCFKKRIFSDKSINNFKCALKDTNWTSIISLANNNPNTNIAYNAFLDKYVELYEIHFPLLTIKRSDKKFPRKQWITPGLIKSCNKKSKLYKQYINNPNEKNEKKFKNYQKNLKKLLIKAEKQYYSQKIKNYGSNLIKMWKTIKTLINKKTPSCSQTNFISNGVEYNNNFHF